MFKKQTLALNKSGSTNTNKQRVKMKNIETPIMVSKEYNCQKNTNNIVKDIEMNIDLKEFNIKSDD